MECPPPSPSAASSVSEDKYSKRRSQNYRLKTRYCLTFVVLFFVLGFPRSRTIFRFIHNHNLQSYVDSQPYLRSGYDKWLQEYRNSPLIPRMITDEKVAFEVLGSYEEAKSFFEKATPPFLVLYYADWCPHSAKAIPVIQEFSKTVLRPNHLRLAAIEESNPFSDNVAGFPTVYLYTKVIEGKPPAKKEFKWKMNRENLVKFLNQNVDRNQTKSQRG